MKEREEGEGGGGKIIEGGEEGMKKDVKSWSEGTNGGMMIKGKDEQ